MKLLFSMLFATVMAFSLQAVTVAWTLQNSAYIATDTTDRVTNWTGQTEDSGATLNVYVVFSTEDFSKTEKYVGAATAVRDAITAGTVGSGNVVMATKDFDTEAGWDTTKTSKLNVTASLNDGAAAGYYYMVVFEGNNTTTNGNYAVAQTTQIAAATTDKNQGVYYNAAGGEVNAAEFVELNWVGGTWDAPRAVPEPTVMALLALGVAGLALRRKNG